MDRGRSSQPGSADYSSLSSARHSGRLRNVSGSDRWSSKGAGGISIVETVTINGIVFSHLNIFCVVGDFYTRIQQDPDLQGPFKSVVDWPEHIKNITHFWWIKFGGRSYLFNNYNPVAKHFFAGFNRELLKRWLVIFHETLRTHLTSEQVAIWTAISNSIGESLAIKNEQYKIKYESQFGSG